MTPYKTNSALYLDYLATVRTRQQIEADPRLCVFLNNPYIKDNMEIALLYNAAKTGDYSDKMAFVEYLMCNGPELDADTILHYRTKIALDPVCTEIAYSYYTDVEQLEELRRTKYNKDGGDGSDYNCFSRPCFYMGRFSSSVGSHASLQNASSMWNCFADALSLSAKDKKKKYTNQTQVSQTRTNTNPSPVTREVLNGMANTAQRAGDAAQSVTAPVTGGQEPVRPSQNQNPEPAPVDARYELWGWIPTSLKAGWGAINALCTANFKDMCLKLQEAGNLDSDDFGDPLSIAFAKKTEILKNANIKRVMGDCARLWDHARRLEIFNVASNASAPVTPSQQVGGPTSGVQVDSQTVNPSDTTASPH